MSRVYVGNPLRSMWRDLQAAWWRKRAEWADQDAEHAAFLADLYCKRDVDYRRAAQAMRAHAAAIEQGIA